MNLFQARHAGAQAFDAGEPQDACPFGQCTEEAGAWLRGWNTARYGATDPVSTQQGTQHEQQRIVFGVAG
jgi:ribosome modulation factor